VNTGVATWWALVDVGLATGDGLGVIPTARIAATRALRLRQNSVNGVG